VQSDTAFKEESVNSSKEGNNSVHRLQEKKDSGTEMHEIFQSEVHDDFWLWHFRFGNLNFRGMKMLHTKDMVKDFSLTKKQERICE
jgi:hypothetical protein